MLDEAVPLMQSDHGISDTGLRNWHTVYQTQSVNVVKIPFLLKHNIFLTLA